MADVTAAENHGLDLIKKTGAYFVNQFHNDNNSLSHAKTTGPEIWKQTGGKIDAFLATVPPVFFLILSKVKSKLFYNVTCLSGWNGRNVHGGKPILKITE